VRVAGDRKWESVSLETIRDVDVDFEMVSYSPMKQNPSVVAETLLQLVPLLMQNPNIDIRRLTEEIVSGMGIPARVLLPEQEVAQKVAAETQLAQQQALGGAAAQGGGPPMGAEGDIPPEMLAALMGAEGGASPEESLAAGGGAPIREGAPPEA